MEQQPEFSFIKDLDLKPANLQPEEGKQSEIIENKSEQMLPVTHCQYCEDADPNCRYCKGRWYDDK